MSGSSACLFDTLQALPGYWVAKTGGVAGYSHTLARALTLQRAKRLALLRSTVESRLWLPGDDSTGRYLSLRTCTSAGLALGEGSRPAGSGSVASTRPMNTCTLLNTVTHDETDSISFIVWLSLLLLQVNSKTVRSKGSAQWFCRIVVI